MLFGLKQFKPKLKQSQAVKSIWSDLRKQFLKLTPEEWVRQHLIHYLVTDRGYPMHLLSVEHHFAYDRRFKRADLICYTPSNQKTLLLVECKAVGRSLQRKDWQQLVTYNHQIQSAVIVLTNGTNHHIMQYDLDGQHRWLQEIPFFESIRQKVLS